MKLLIDAQQISQQVQLLADQINERYTRSLTVVAVMKGSIVFVSDLIRQLQMPVRLHIVTASSYREATTAGELSLDIQNLAANCERDIEARDVLIVDDIFDTGNTLTALSQEVRLMSPKTLECAVLLLKEERVEVDWRPTYYGFKIPDSFVVGYGLDYADLYRNLPAIFELEAHEIEGSWPHSEEPDA